MGLQGVSELLQMVSGSVHDGWESPQFGSGPRQLSLRAAGVEGSAWCGSVHGVSGGILVKTYESAGGSWWQLGSGHAT